MNKLLISEISIDLHLQSFTHLAQQNLEGKKKRERKYIQLLTPFSLLLDKDVVTEGDHLLSHQAGGREVSGGGWGENKFSFLCSSKYINDHSISGASPSSSAI